MDINTILEDNEYENIFEEPPTQADHYIGQNSHPKIIKLSRMHNKTYGARQERASRLQFNMNSDTPSGWDHIKMNKKIEQKSIRRDKNGLFGSYMHIEPTHRWDYLMVVKLDYQEWTTYIIKKSSIVHFIENIANNSFISVQGDTLHSNEGYLLKENVPDSIREEYYTLISSEQDLIDYIQSDLTNT
jgi:hypothetical protein